MVWLRYEHGDVCSYDIERLLLPVDIMMVLVTYGNTGVSASLSFKWILLPVHIDVNTALYVQVVLEWRISGMVKVGEMNARHGQPSTARPHGPIWQTFETIGARNPCRLFQKSIPGGPSRPSVHGRLPRPTLTNFCNNRRQESVPFVSKVPPGGPSRTSVTARSDELLKQTAPHTDALRLPVVQRRRPLKEDYC